MALRTGRPVFSFISTSSSSSGSENDSSNMLSSTSSSDTSDPLYLELFERFFWGLPPPECRFEDDFRDFLGEDLACEGSKSVSLESDLLGSKVSSLRFAGMAIMREMRLEGCIELHDQDKRAVGWSRSRVCSDTRRDLADDAWSSKRCICRVAVDAGEAIEQSHSLGKSMTGR
ncbi:hypothetical protein BKA64DRAFT_653716 [Cadophora sp. MPI-SDFR-AT-0126]|nr:hypothetical protein BKA64DRAFT_653716 [Leotiomycetes sp. MPI-SDFR-AT-0126]